MSRAASKTLLQHLPNELLLEIFDLSLPYGFENLVQVCRHFYTLARPRLSHHKELRQSFRYFKFFIGWDSWPLSPYTCRDIPELLICIAKEPLIASYIVHANLDDESHTNLKAIKKPRGYREPNWKCEENLIKKLVQSSDILAGTTHGPDEWFNAIMDDIMKGFMTHPLLFLLTLLPNVETLVLPWMQVDGWPNGDEDVQEEVLQLMVNRANAVNLMSQALHQLRLVNSTYYFTEPLKHFLSLNSIREVYGLHQDLGGWEDACETVRLAPGRNLEILELSSYGSDLDQCCILFNNMEHLKELRYHLGMLWSPNEFGQAITQCLGRHLKRLSLTVDADFTYKGTLQQIDFQGLVVLETLEMDVVLFHECRNTQLPDLTKLLPRSLRLFRLFGYQILLDSRCLKKLFVGFESRRKETFPFLETVEAVLRQLDSVGRTETITKTYHEFENLFQEILGARIIAAKNFSGHKFAHRTSI